MYEKKISPKKNKLEMMTNIKILKFKLYKKIEVIKKEIKDPDHVFLGLIFGIIKGPPINLPAMYATVSLKKDNKIKR